MKKERAFYWISQAIGWLLFVLLILFQNFLEDNVNIGIIKVLIANFIIGISLSHLMRIYIIRQDYLLLPIPKLLPQIILLSLFFGVVASISYALVSDLFFSTVIPILIYPFSILLKLFIPFSSVFLFWNILYFAANYLKNYEREEIKNLRLRASINEVELNNLKAQLNPHFMFNALNSIRALINENPKQAKTSITQLSNILRNTLMVGKQKEVSLEEEIRVVTDYLELEKVRYEERLRYFFKIDPNVLQVMIPPLMIQTLVENSIKHGISKLTKGGDVVIVAKADENNFCQIEIQNTGSFKHSGGKTGIGLSNTEKRLQLIYGDRAGLQIFEENNIVICRVYLPFSTIKEKEYENSVD